MQRLETFITIEQFTCQCKRFLQSKIFVWGDDVLPDAASHDLPEVVHLLLVGAGVVQHVKSTMLNIVTPSLNWQESEIIFHGNCQIFFILNIE